MMKTPILIFVALLCLGISATAQVKKKIARRAPAKKVLPKKNLVKIPMRDSTRLPGQRIKLITDSGTVILRLYDKTPLHRDNFIKLVKDHYYDSLLFHRVISSFMIQGGDPNSKNAIGGQMLGLGGPGYRIPAEFDSTLFHKRGALAAAREGDQVNPKKESSGSQFYIVHGKKLTDPDLDMLEQTRMLRKIPATLRDHYKKEGGVPHLDMNYTVFGEVESGFEVIDKIANAARDNNNRPYNDIRMKLELIQ